MREKKVDTVIAQDERLWRMLQREKGYKSEWKSLKSKIIYKIGD